MGKKSKKGQSAVEYILLIASTVLVLVFVLSRQGIVTVAVNDSLDIAVDGIECMARQVCYKPGGCPTLCPNDCCEAKRHEQLRCRDPRAPRRCRQHWEHRCDQRCVVRERRKHAHRY